MKTKIEAFLQLFCDYGLSSVPTKRKQAVMQPITCAFAPQSAIGKLATIRNRKKVAKTSRLLFLDSRSSFGMTIWSGRTQRSIVISFSAAPMRGNRILRSAVPVGRRIPYSVALWSGGAYRTAWQLPWAPPRPPPPSIHRLLRKRANQQFTKPSQLTGHN